MKCPQCNKQTISFSFWSKGINAFRWVCPHCGAKLAANRTVVVCFVLSLVLLVSVLLLGFHFLPEYMSDTRLNRKVVVFGAALLTAGPFLLLSWFKGGYKIRG